MTFDHLKRGIVLIAIVGILLGAILWAARERPVETTGVQDQGGTALVVLLHGYQLEGADLQSVEDTVRTIPGLENASVLRPDLPLGMFSTARPGQILAELLVAIDRAWEDRSKRGKPYQRIVLVGHSIGALYARKLYAAACGENKEAPFDNELVNALAAVRAAPISQPRQWAGAVDRIVLLAGMNRGWSISHHMSPGRAAIMQVGVGIGHIISWIYGRPPIIFTVRRGSPFITELRLQWLAMREHAKVIRDKALGDAVTVQLLGTIDDLVSPDDNVDLVSGQDFVFLEVEHSGHRNVIDMQVQEKDPGRSAAEKRRKALKDAFAVDAPKSNALSPVESSLTVDREVTDVVFVIHGIRDEGHWTRKIAHRVRLAGEALGRRVATETSTYGYFPMLSFLRPGARQEKVEWLMDRYTHARASYPKARFHYIGHSHGTYLLTRVLRDYPAVTFDNVVFAGSVAHRAYEWNEFVPHRAKAVLNFVASADWVVAFFPNALQNVGIQDLGSAGHTGFDAAARQPPLVVEPRDGDGKIYVEGGHSAALDEAMWNAIARFTMTGEFEVPREARMKSEQAPLVAWPAKFAPVIWIAIALLIAYGFYRLLILRRREWVKTLLIVAYCGAIWTVLTEF